MHSFNLYFSTESQLVRTVGSWNFPQRSDIDKINFVQDQVPQDNQYWNCLL